MSSIVPLTRELAGDLGECYYKEFCTQHDWAYCSLEQIHNTGIKKGILEFKLGYVRPHSPFCATQSV